MTDIKYRLCNVSIEQFAMLFEPEGDRIAVDVSIMTKKNYGERALAVGANVQYIENGNTFLVAEVFCHYEIDETSWNELSSGCKKDVVLPEELMATFADIAVDTARGAICAKTENTPFSKYYLPIMEIERKGDGNGYVIHKNPSTSRPQKSRRG